MAFLLNGCLRTDRQEFRIHGESKEFERCVWNLQPLVRIPSKTAVNKARTPISCRAMVVFLLEIPSACLVRPESEVGHRRSRRVPDTLSGPDYRITSAV